MKPHNGDPAGKFHRLRIHVAGIEVPLFYTIPQKEWERIWSFLQVAGWEGSPFDRKAFLLFESLDPQVTVIVRITEMELVHFLVDPMVLEVQDESEPPDWHLRIFFRNRKVPLELFVEDPIHANDLIIRLDTEPEAKGQFFPLTDIEGEDVVVNVDQIMVAEVHSGIIEVSTNNRDPEDEEHEADDIPF